MDYAALSPPDASIDKVATNLPLPAFKTTPMDHDRDIRLQEAMVAVLTNEAGLLSSAAAPTYAPGRGLVFLARPVFIGLRGSSII
jgi:hypothetical protein